MNRHFTVEFHRKGPLAPTLLGLATARYLILLVGAGMLLWQTVVVFLLNGGGTFIGAMAVGLVTMLVPAMVWVISREGHLLRQLDEQAQGLTAPTERNGEQRRGVITRYLLLLIGAGVVVWEGTQAFWLEGGGAFRGVVGVGLGAMLVPAIVWVMSRERRLQRQLAQRSREIKALNRLFQTHLLERMEQAPTSPEEIDGPQTQRGPIIDGHPQPLLPGPGEPPTNDRGHQVQEHTPHPA